MFICFTFYSLAGFFGYLTFADSTEQLTASKYGGIILLADYHNSIEVTAALLAIGVSITFALPFNTKPCKDCLLDIFAPGVKVDSNFSHFVFTAIVCMTSLIAGLYVPMMSDVITLMGAVSSPLVLCLYHSLGLLRLPHPLLPQNLPPDSHLPKVYPRCWLRGLHDTIRHFRSH